MEQGIDFLKFASKIVNSTQSVKIDSGIFDHALFDDTLDINQDL